MKPDKEKLKEIILELLIGAAVTFFTESLLATIRWIVIMVLDLFT